MFIKKMRFFIIFFLLISINNLRAEFFEDLSKIIDDNNKRLSYGISVSDVDVDGNYEFIVTGFGYPNLALSFKNGKLKNINQQDISGEFLFLYGSNVFPRKPWRTNLLNLLP